MNSNYQQILTQVRDEYFDNKNISIETFQTFKDFILSFNPQQYLSIFQELKYEDFLGELNDIFIELVPHFPLDIFQDNRLYDTIFYLGSHDKLVPTLELILEKVEKNEYNMKVFSSSIYDQIMSKLLDEEDIIEVNNLAKFIKKNKLAFDENHEISNINHCISYDENDHFNLVFFEKKLYAYCKVIQAYGLFEKFKQELNSQSLTLLAFVPKKEKENIQNILHATFEKVQLEDLISAKNSKAQLKI